MVILNTCHIREKATEKVYSELGRLAPERREGQSGGRMMVAVAGCIAQAEGEEIIAAPRWWIWWWGRNPIIVCRK